MHPIIMKYSTELRRHHQVLFGIKMLALHNALQQKESSDSSKGFLGCNPRAPGPLCVWPSDLNPVNHRTGKHSQCGGQTWPRQLSPIQEQKKLMKRERSVTHTAFAELLQPMVLFVTTDKDLSGKEGEILLAIWF